MVVWSIVSGLLSLVVVALFLIIIVWWHKRSNEYFKRRAIPFIPAPLFGGHLKDMLLQRKAITDVLVDLYNDKDTKDAPAVGVRFLHKHGLMLKDLSLIKRILVKDFHNFTDRRTSSDPGSDILGGSNMFLAKNPMWKQIRTKMSPVFSGAKMRQFLDTINGLGEELHQHLERNVSGDSTVMDVKDVIALFTTDVIATCAYGVQANSLRDKDSEFRKQGKTIFDFSPIRAIEFGLLFFWPETVPYLRLKMFNRNATRFLRNTLKYVMDERESNKIMRNDLIDILLGLRQADRGKACSYDEKVVFDDDILVAQAAVFFTAGFETTSSAISFTLHEFAKQVTYTYNSFTKASII